jgi:hypothetical protein
MHISYALSDRRLPLCGHILLASVLVMHSVVSRAGCCSISESAFRMRVLGSCWVELGMQYIYLQEKTFYNDIEINELLYKQSYLSQICSSLLKGLVQLSGGGTLNAQRITKHLHTHHKHNAIILILP